MLYIASDQKEGITPTEMGEKEPQQACRSLPPMAEAASRATEGRHLSMAPQEFSRMECLPTPVASQESRPNQPAFAVQAGPPR